MNINFSTQAIDMGAKAALGYAIGVLTATNAKLWAAIGVIQSVAKLVLTQTGILVFGKKFDAKMIEDTAEFISHGGAIIALQQLSLISIRMAGLLGVVASLYCLAKRNWTNETKINLSKPEVTV